MHRIRYKATCRYRNYEVKTTVLWQATRSRKHVRFRFWVGHSAVFDTQSGNTHLLNDIATKLFAELLEGGKSLIDLEEACLDDLRAVDDSGVTSKDIQVTLSHLSRIGLAERRAG